MGLHQHHADVMDRSRDMRPAAQVLFFASPKQSTQKKGAPYYPRPYGFAFGQPAPPNPHCGAPQLAVRALHAPLKHAGASQFTKRLCPSAQPPAAWAGCRRRGYKGGVRNGDGIASL